MRFDFHMLCESNNIKQVTESDLIKAVKKGDRTAFEQVFRSYYADLCRIVFRYVKNTDDSQEIVQGLFVKIWQKHAEITIVGSLKNYLYRAAVNHTLNFINQQEVLRKHIKYVDDETLRDVAEEPEESEIQELENQLRLAILEMPEKRRKIFELSRFERLKYHEIAQHLGLSIKTVETQMSRAIAHLKNRFIKKL